MLLLRILETAFITANWIELCPLIGPHLYINTAFKALNLSVSDIMRLTSKLVNPEACYEGFRAGGEDEEAEEGEQR